MQSNSKVLQGIISKIQSPLSQIRNRAVTTLYTKVSAKIIDEYDLLKSKDLPGVLMNWINQTQPTNKDCLYKVLSVLHRYTFLQQGITLLVQYECLQFLQELRKFLLSNQMNVDEHVDLIKKIIKQILPFQNKREKRKQQRSHSQQNDQQQSSKTRQLKQQQDDQQSNELKNQQKHKKSRKKSNNQLNSVKQNVEKKKTKQQSHIIPFNCLNDYLPKSIDQQLYALLIQLKHGKKQSILQTLIKIQQIIDFWGSRYFKYKQDLVRQLGTIIQGKVYSQVAIRVISTILKQLLQMEDDIGIRCQNDENNLKRKLHKTTKIGTKGTNIPLQKIYLQIRFQIFQDNPFTYKIIQTLILKNKAATLSGQLVQYLLQVIQKFNFSASFLPQFLIKVQKNIIWIKEKFQVNKFYQQQILRVVNHCCSIQPNLYSEVIPQLLTLFPSKSLQQLSSKIPSLHSQLQQKEIQQSFDVLSKYSTTQNKTHAQNFDFNLQLHQLQAHIKFLEKGLQGLPKKPQVISLYIDCMLMLAIAVAREDPLMSYYPKIKSLILKISEHKYLNCRTTLYEILLISFNSSEKINYLSQSYLKSQITRLVFSDGDFYSALLINSLNQEQTIGSFLQITKLIQTTTKQENHKYLNKYSPIFYILSYHSNNQSALQFAGLSISSGAKIIISRIQKKYQVVNMLLTLFLKSKQQRIKTYVNILGLNQKDDLLKTTIQYSVNPQKKSLKYSLSTIKNYMNIIMSPKIQPSIKASAISQMIQCVQRIDLLSVQKQQQFLNQILTIHSSISNYIKGFLQESEKSQQIQFFIQLVRIYSILEKRFRLQTNYLNQSIKCLAPEVYLNVLINVCGAVGDSSMNSQKYRNVVSELMMVIYYHCFRTWTSNLLLSPNLDNLSQKSQKLNGNKNQIKAHWIIKIFPFQEVLKISSCQIQSIPIRTQFSSNKNSSVINQSKQKALLSFLKGYKLNIKSINQLFDLYIRHISQYGNNMNLDQNEVKIKKNIVCPIFQRQLSTALHNLNDNRNQLSFLMFLFQSFSPINSSSKSLNLFQHLQQIIPHLLNQLIKPNVPQYIKSMLINISNLIGWKRTKQFQGIFQQLTSSNQLYLLKLIKRMPKLSPQQFSKIVKIGLSDIDNISNANYVYILYQILLKPSNLQLIIFSSTQYTQLLILNSIPKIIQSLSFDSKLINFASILLYQILHQILVQLKHISNSLSITNLSSRNFDYQINENQNQHKYRKIIQLTKLISSLSLGPNFISYILQQFQKSQNSNLTYQNLCFMIQTLKIIYKISDFVAENQLLFAQDTNINHQNKIITLFFIKIGQNIRLNTQFSNNCSMEVYYTSIFNFFCSIIKLNTFKQATSQVDLLDLSLTLMHQKVKNLQKKSDTKKINPKLHQTYLLFASIFDYIFTRIQQEPSENSHYLLSSTSLLQSSLQLLNHLNHKMNQTKQIQPIKLFIKQVLEKLGKVIHTISVHQEDYFIFKLNQYFEEFQNNFDLLQTFGNLTSFGEQCFIICFMRIILIWQGKTQNNRNSVHKNINEVLNSIQIFQKDSQSEDDSSLQQRQLFEKPKIPYQNNWIYKTIILALEKNYLKLCKSLIALSFPAKLFLLQSPIFLQYLKRATHLIDNKIVIQTNANKRKGNKKSVITANNNSSGMLSNSRRTVVSQAPSYLPVQDNSKSNSQKMHQIQQYMKILISLFALNDKELTQQKLDFMANKFNSHFNKCREAMRKIFYTIDKLYTLSQLMTSNLESTKDFSSRFLTLITSLSQSSLFSQPLSNHLSQVSSPMLEQSISTIQKSISTQLSQHQYEKLKQALMLLTTLSSHQSVRSYIYKHKLIEELNARIIKYQQKQNNKLDSVSLNSLFDITCFYLNLSKYKDSHSKILNDKKVLQVLINQVYMQKSTLLSQKILQLLSNLCAYKANKSMFMQNRQIHKTILGQLESQQIQYKTNLLTLLYNLMYRHAPAVKLYKRKDVIDMLNTIDWKNCQNWENVAHIYGAVFEVLESSQNYGDKN